MPNVHVFRKSTFGLQPMKMGVGFMKWTFIICGETIGFQPTAVPLIGQMLWKAIALLSRSSPLQSVWKIEKRKSDFPCLAYVHKCIVNIIN